MNLVKSVEYEKIYLEDATNEFHKVDVRITFYQTQLLNFRKLILSDPALVFQKVDINIDFT